MDDLGSWARISTLSWDSLDAGLHLLPVSTGLNDPSVSPWISRLLRCVCLCVCVCEVHCAKAHAVDVHVADVCERREVLLGSLVPVGLWRILT